MTKGDELLIHKIYLKVISEFANGDSIFVDIKNNKIVSVPITNNEDTSTKQIDSVKLTPVTEEITGEEIISITVLLFMFAGFISLIGYAVIKYPLW